MKDGAKKSEKLDVCIYSRDVYIHTCETFVLVLRHYVNRSCDIYVVHLPIYIQELLEVRAIYLNMFHVSPRGRGVVEDRAIYVHIIYLMICISIDLFL